MMILSTVRRIATVVAIATAALVAGCGHGGGGSRSHDIEIEVRNYHRHVVAIEGVDDDGHHTLFGYVLEDEDADFIVSPYWAGRTVEARCTVDDSHLDLEFAYDGLLWDVF